MLDQLNHDYAALAERVRLLETAMSPLESLQADYAALASRVDALESQPPPPPPPTGRITASRFRLLGGWKINQSYAKPGMAIDFSTMRAYVGGHAQDNYIGVYDLPQMGQGGDIATWPTVTAAGRIERFWDGGNARGVMVRDGKLWVSTKVFYDTSPGNAVLSSLNLTTSETSQAEIPLSKPAFGGGFIKGHPSQWMVGCGGYESGQKSVAGPTAALVDGTILLNQANHGTMVFEDRELRTPNYSAAADTWMTLNPRDGVGRWAADRVYAGGIWRADGLCFWPIQAVGDIDYKRQSETFSKEKQSMLYTYDPQLYDRVAFENWPHGFVIGQDVDNSGLVYLLCRDAWRVSSTRTIPVIKVFEII